MSKMELPIVDGLNRVVYEAQKAGKGPAGFMETTRWAQYSINAAEVFADHLSEGRDGSGQTLTAIGREIFLSEVKSNIRHADVATEAGGSINSSQLERLDNLKRKFPDWEKRSETSK